MVLLMQCFVENVLKPSLLQDVVMSTQEVQNDEGMVNEGKKKWPLGWDTKKPSSVKFVPGSYMCSAVYQHDLQILL